MAKMATIEKADQIIGRIFDPHCRKRGCDLAPMVKYKYLENYLREHWQDVCGANLAKNCCVDTLENGNLYITTSNSMLANELFMMQSLFLAKLNKLLEGRTKIKKLFFHSGTLKRHLARKKRAKEEAEAAKNQTLHYCERCGVIVRTGGRMCNVCERQEKEEMRAKLMELLRIQPWLTYKNCLEYYNCDKILFTAVKEELENYYFEQVRYGYNTTKEGLIATLFLTGKRPEEIDMDKYNNALTFLRRKKSVSTSRSRLDGKK